MFTGAARLAVGCALLPSILVLTYSPKDVTQGRDLALLVSGLPLLVSLVAAVWDYGRLPHRKLPKMLWGAKWLGIPELLLRLAFIVCAVLVTWWSIDIVRAIVEGLESADMTLFWQRARSLGSRTSPLLPIILVGLTCAFWCLWHRTRARILARKTPLEWALRQVRNWPAPLANHVWQRLAEAAADVRCRLGLMTPTSRAMAVLLVLTLIAAAGWQTMPPHTLEAVTSSGLDAPFRKLILFGLLGGLALAAMSIDRLLEIWSALKEFLSWTEHLPLRVAFDRLPHQVSRLTQLTPPISPHRIGVLRTWQAQRWDQLRRLLPPTSPETFSEVGRLPMLAERLDREWAVEPVAAVRNDVATALKELRQPSADPRTASVSGKLRQSVPSVKRLWVLAAEEYVAADIVDYVDWTVNSLRWIAVFIAVEIACLTLLFFSYPIGPSAGVRAFYMAVFGVALLALFWISADMSRNPTLSRMTGTEPGKVTWDRSLLTNVIVLVGIPLVSYLGATLPEMRGLLSTVFAPVMHLFTR